MLHIGCHLSASRGFAAMGRQALELKADTFQFFTRNPRGSRAKDLDPADAAALRELLTAHHFAPLIAHAPYTLNLCGAEEKKPPLCPGDHGGRPQPPGAPAGPVL